MRTGRNNAQHSPKSSRKRLMRMRTRGTSPVRHRTSLIVHEEHSICNGKNKKSIKTSHFEPENDINRTRHTESKNPIDNTLRPVAFPTHSLRNKHLTFPLGLLDEKSSDLNTYQVRYTCAGQVRFWLCSIPLAVGTRSTQRLLASHRQHSQCQQVGLQHSKLSERQTEPCHCSIVTSTVQPRPVQKLSLGFMILSCWIECC